MKFIQKNLCAAMLLIGVNRVAKLVEPGFAGDTCLAQTARPELKDARSYRTRGLASFDSEQFDLALQDLKKAAAMEPKTMTSFDYRMIGDCYLKSQRPADAVAMYNKAMQTPPHKATSDLERRVNAGQLAALYFVRARALATLKRYSEALKDADKVVAANPDKSWAFDFRAHIDDKLMKYQQVVEDCTTSIRFNPNSLSSYGLRAAAYEKLGKKNLAELDRKRLYALTGKDP